MILTGLRFPRVDAVAGKPDLIITQAGAVHTAAALTKTTDRVLKGADPATMPVELPTTFELVVTRSTADTLVGAAQR